MHYITLFGNIYLVRCSIYGIIVTIIKFCDHHHVFNGSIILQSVLCLYEFIAEETQHVMRFVSQLSLLGSGYPSRHDFSTKCLLFSFVKNKSINMALHGLGTYFLEVQSHNNKNAAK